MSMTAFVRPDLSEIDASTLRRMRVWGTVFTLILGFAGVVFFILWSQSQKISDVTKNRLDQVLTIAGISLLAGGTMLLMGAFWYRFRRPNLPSSPPEKSQLG